MLNFHGPPYPPVAPPRTSYAYVYRFIVLVFVVGILLVMVTVWNNRNVRRYSPAIKIAVNEVVETAARHVVLSRETSNPLLALWQANIAAGQMAALKTLAPGDDLTHLAHVRFTDIENEVRKQQWQALQRVFQVCPNLRPVSSMSSIAGWYPSEQQYSPSV